MAYKFGENEASTANLSPANYDAILLSWSTQNVQPNVIFDAGVITYSASAASARSKLSSAPNSWKITDGGQK